MSGFPRSTYLPLLHTRRFRIVALDWQGHEIGAVMLRARDHDQAATFGPRLLCWELGAVSLADRGWVRTRVHVWQSRSRRAVVSVSVEARR